MIPKLMVRRQPWEGMATEGPDGGRTIKAVEHSLSILEYLYAAGPSTLSTIADRIGLSPGSTHTHLATLAAHGFIEQRDQEYALSRRLIGIGERARNQQAVFQAAKNPLHTLADETGEAAHLIQEYDGLVLLLYEVYGAEAAGVEYHSHKRDQLIRHLHCTASGKALLAKLPRDRVEEIVESAELVQNTPNTITDPDDLYAELERVEERGYAISDEEQMLGMRAVGAPVMRVDGTVAAAISVSGPPSRLKGDRLREELRDAVLRAVEETEINLNTSTF